MLQFVGSQRVGEHSATDTAGGEPSPCKALRPSLMERECHLVATYGLTSVISNQRSQEPDLETGITKVIAPVTVTMATR